MNEECDNHLMRFREDGSKRGSSSSSWWWWASYREWAIRHQVPISLVDEIVGRLLFWAPANDKERNGIHNELSPGWREIAWACLQLHRLSFQVATNEWEESYGTSVAPPCVDPHVPATATRLGITVLQNLGPVIQELVRNPRSETVTARRQINVRLWIERIRFVLRLYLLGNYWQQLTKYDTIQAGVLLNGGAVYSRPVCAPTVDQEAARLARQNYVGRRTGRRLGREHGKQDAVQEYPGMAVTKLRLIAGELLYILRPLITTETDSIHLSGSVGASSKAWLLALVTDLLSLKLLLRDACTGNEMTRAEIQRRKVRLFLHLVRTPVWDRATRPALDRLDDRLRRLPLLGMLLSNYIWECVYYWKLYGAEEG